MPFCLIFLLKRRRALSKVSPSRTLTSDTVGITSFGPPGGRQEYVRNTVVVAAIVLSHHREPSADRADMAPDGYSAASGEPLRAPRSSGRPIEPPAPRDVPPRRGRSMRTAATAASASARTASPNAAARLCSTIGPARAEPNGTPM